MLLQQLRLPQTSAAADWRGGDPLLWWELKWGQSHCGRVPALQHAVHLCGSTPKQDAVHGFGRVPVLRDKCGTADWQKRQLGGNWLTDLSVIQDRPRKLHFPELFQTHTQRCCLCRNVTDNWDLPFNLIISGLVYCLHLFSGQCISEKDTVLLLSLYCKCCM